MQQTPSDKAVEAAYKAQGLTDGERPLSVEEVRYMVQKAYEVDFTVGEKRPVKTLARPRK